MHQKDHKAPGKKSQPNANPQPSNQPGRAPAASKATPPAAAVGPSSNLVEQQNLQKQNAQLKELNTQLTQKLMQAQRELKASRQVETETVADSLSWPWQADQNKCEYAAKKPEFELDKKKWQEARNKLSAAEKNLCADISLDSHTLLKNIETRNNHRRELYRLSCDFTAKYPAWLIELETFMKALTAYTSVQPTPTATLTQELLLLNWQWIQNIVPKVQAKAVQKCEELTILITEIKDLIEKATHEISQQQNLLNRQDAAFQLTRDLIICRARYQNNCDEILHLRDLIKEELADDIDKDKLAKLQTDSAIVRADYIQALSLIRDYKMDFEEFVHFEKDAPESPWLSLGDFATQNGITVALKQGEKALIAREYHVLRRLQHPFIMTALAMFANSPTTAILVTPWLENEALHKWMEKKPSLNAITDMFRSVMQALSVVHAAGVIHGNLCPQNILIQNSGQPLVCGFENSIDPTFVGIEEAETPALKSFESDVFALGGCIWQVFFPYSPWYMRDSDAYPEVPPMTGTELRTVLQSMLRCDPKERPSINTALALPFFKKKTPFAEMTCHDSNERLKAFRHAIDLVYDTTAASQQNTPVVLVNVRPDHMLKDIAEKLWATHNQLNPNFSVHFKGEDGIDAGALTTAMYVRFIKEAFSANSGLFEIGSCGKYLPVAIDHLDDQKLLFYRAVGIALARILIDERAVIVPLTLSVFKFLLGAPDYEMGDLEQFDSQKCRNLSQLLSTNSDCSMYGFEQVGEHAKEVTEANKDSFVKKYIQWELMGSRMAPLLALREGFECFGENITPLLRNLTCIDLKMLLSGSEDLDPNLVLKRLKFSKFPPKSKTPSLLRQVIETFPSKKLMQFLNFVTAQETLPLASNERQIEVKYVKGGSGRLPESHACFWQLLLTDYDTYHELRKDLLTAIENGTQFTLR